MESSMDSPALALFNPPLHHTHSHTLARPSAKHFVTRSLHNLRQGNLALFVVFCGCLVIFTRALFGAGYDEGLSAHADAASAKHPSLLARWTPHSQHALEEQWKKLRERSAEGGLGLGLWAKIRKEDETTSPAAHVPGSEALHWLRAMEDRALAGLGRRAAHEAAGAAHDQRHADIATPNKVQAPIVAPPEHDISEDLDEHDAHDGDVEHHHAAVAPHKAAPPVEPLPSPADPAPSAASEHPAAAAAPSSREDSPVETSAEPVPSRISELEDADDQPVYHRREPK